MSKVSQITTVIYLLPYDHFDAVEEEENFDLYYYLGQTDLYDHFDAVGYQDVDLHAADYPDNRDNRYI